MPKRTKGSGSSSSKQELESALQDAVQKLQAKEGEVDLLKSQAAAASAWKDDLSEQMQQHEAVARLLKDFEVLQHDAQADLACYENEVLAAEVKGLEEKLRLFDFEQQEEGNQQLRKQVQQLHEENMALSQELSSISQNAKVDVARVQLLLEREYRAALHSISERVRGQLLEELDQQQQQMMQDHKQLSSDVQYLRHHHSSMAARYRQVREKASRLKIDAEIAEGMQEMQSQEVVALRSQLRSMQQRGAALEALLLAAVRAHPSIVPTLQGVQLPGAPAAAAAGAAAPPQDPTDAAAAMSSMAQQMQELDSYCQRLKQQRAKWKARARQWSRSCALLQQHLHACREAAAPVGSHCSSERSPAVWSAAADAEHAFAAAASASAARQDAEAAQHDAKRSLEQPELEESRKPDRRPGCLGHVWVSAGADAEVDSVADSVEEAAAEADPPGRPRGRESFTFRPKGRSAPHDEDLRLTAASRPSTSDTAAVEAAAQPGTLQETTTTTTSTLGDAAEGACEMVDPADSHHATSSQAQVVRGFPTVSSPSASPLPKPAPGGFGGSNYPEAGDPGARPSSPAPDSAGAATCINVRPEPSSPSSSHSIPSPDGVELPASPPPQDSILDRQHPSPCQIPAGSWTHSWHEAGESAAQRSVADAGCPDTAPAEDSVLDRLHEQVLDPFLRKDFHSLPPPSASITGMRVSWLHRPHPSANAAVAKTRKPTSTTGSSGRRTVGSPSSQAFSAIQQAERTFDGIAAEQLGDLRAGVRQRPQSAQPPASLQELRSIGRSDAEAQARSRRGRPLRPLSVGTASLAGSRRPVSTKPRPAFPAPNKTDQEQCASRADNTGGRRRPSRSSSHNAPFTSNRRLAAAGLTASAPGMPRVRPISATVPGGGSKRSSGRLARPATAQRSRRTPMEWAELADAIQDPVTSLFIRR